MKNLQPLKVGTGWTVIMNELLCDKNFYEEEKKLLTLNFDAYVESGIELQVYWAKNNIGDKGYFKLNYIDSVNMKSYSFYSLEELTDKINIVTSNNQAALQPLSIPAGWKVYNNLENLNPKSESKESDIWNTLIFVEDICQFTCIKNNDEWIVDVGFYPENNPNGKFGLLVIKNSDWVTPVYSFRTKCLLELTAKINELLYSVPYGEDKC